LILILKKLEKVHGNVFPWEGVGTSKIRTSNGQNIEKAIRMIRTLKRQSGH
jgi:hypothetical protein